jgi:phenylacetate-CoA ligase
MSDSVQLAAGYNCLCGRRYAVITGIQGREQEALTFTTANGQRRTVQPLVFHHIMDRVTAASWQVKQHGDELEVLLAQPRDINQGALAGAIYSALAGQGVKPPRIKVREVATIPRTALGKAPLIVPE